MYNYEAQAVISTKNSILFIALLCMVMQRDTTLYSTALMIRSMMDHSLSMSWKTNKFVSECCCPSEVRQLQLSKQEWKDFHSWCTLAKELQKKSLVYYGVHRLGKGLVDAMSAFGVKNPLKWLVIWGDFEFDSSLESSIDSEQSMLTTKTGCTTTLT